MIPHWLVAIAGTIAFFWSWNSCALSIARSFGAKPDNNPWLAGLRWVVSELRPLYLPAVLVLIADYSLRGQLIGWNLLWSAGMVFNWFYFKDEGDDRWKRRRKKATEKVKALASGRLVAVPVGASR